MKRIVFGTKNNPRTAQHRDCQVLHAHGRPRIELPRVLGAGRQPNARTHSRPRPRQVGGMFLRSGGGKTPDKMPQKHSVNSFL